MTISVKKDVTITITGSDVQRLVDTCEIVRRRWARTSELTIDYDMPKDKIQTFINFIFDAGIGE